MDSFERMGNTVHSPRSNTKLELEVEKLKPSVAVVLHKQLQAELRTPLVERSKQRHKDSHS
jgi:hypothetical protein